jgi:hypothetical protein
MLVKMASNLATECCAVSVNATSAWTAQRPIATLERRARTGRSLERFRSRLVKRKRLSLQCRCRYSEWISEAWPVRMINWSERLIRFRFGGNAEAGKVDAGRVRHLRDQRRPIFELGLSGDEAMDLTFDAILIQQLTADGAVDFHPHRGELILIGELHLVLTPQEGVQYVVVEQQIGRGGGAIEKKHGAERHARNQEEWTHSECVAACAMRESNP